MSKKLILALMLLSLCAGAPTMAASDDDDDAPAKTEAKSKSKSESKPEKSKPEKSKPASKSKASKKGNQVLSATGEFLGTAAKRIGATIPAFIVSVPVAEARIFAQQNVEHAKSIPFVGESKNPVFVWTTRAFMIPTAFFSATVQAPVYSATNAWKTSDDKAFSKEAFFMGDLDERMSTQ